MHIIVVTCIIFVIKIYLLINLKNKITGCYVTSKQKTNCDFFLYSNTSNISLTKNVFSGKK